MADSTNFAAGFFMLSGPLNTALHKHIEQDRSSGDNSLIMAVSSLKAQEEGLGLSPSQRLDVLQHFSLAKAASRGLKDYCGYQPQGLDHGPDDELLKALASDNKPEMSQEEEVAKTMDLFAQCRAAKSYAQRAKELEALIQAFKHGQDASAVEYGDPEDLEREMMQDVLADIRTTFAEDNSESGVSAQRDIEEMAKFLDRSRSAHLYAKKAKETYDFIAEKIENESALILEESAEESAEDTT